MGYLKKYIRKYCRLFLLALFFLSVEALCDLLQPMVMSRIVDKGVRSRDLAYVLRAGALMVGITAVGAVGAVARNNISSRVSQWFGTELRSDLFRKIQSLSFRSADAFDTASLVTRLTNDVTQMQNFVNGMMRIFVKSPLLCIGSIVLSVILEPRLSRIIAVLVPLIVLVIYLNNRIGYPFFRRVQRAVDRLNGVMREFLSGVRVVKAFNRAEYEKERFSRSNEGLADVQTTAMRVTSVFSPVMMLTVNLGIVCVLWLGGYAVNSGQVQVGKIIAFINYMTQMANSLMMISNVFNMFVRARASTERIGEVMAVPGETTGKGRPAAGPRTPGVEMRRVTFSYSGTRETAALRDVSFAVGPGMTLGIIGTTGSGKTTLVNLIPRFYQADEGQVLVDGEDVRTADIRALRARIGIVPQKNVLFSGTILENIRWGRRDATPEEAARAARLAQIHDFIAALPQGYDTPLGQGGVNLSGGQKQRIAIARALVRQPSILILDDCTSAVDAVTEKKIREGLRQFSHDLICITIAQRIASVMDADRILVLDQGAVCGFGTHEELLQSCRVYREIALSQFGKAGEAHG